MKQLILTTLLLLLAACSSTPQQYAYRNANTEKKMNELIMYAMSLADTPYRYGGDTPKEGFDCSGFVGFVYQHALGVSLPRTTHELSHSGFAVNRNRLLPGDLVFFNTEHRPYSHVGIYVGDDKFVHSPKTGSVIHVEKMSLKYWAERYNGARRIKV